MLNYGLLQIFELSKMPLRNYSLVDSLTKLDDVYLDFHQSYKEM